MISTPRFLLRPLNPEDATPRYSAWFEDETALNYIATAKSAHTVAELRDYIRERAGSNDVLFLGIFTRDTGMHIGNIKYEPIRAAERDAVMGILIGEKAWRGKGVAEEVILASADFLRRHRGTSRIYLGVLKTHTSARKSYKKAGFHVVADAPFPFDPAVAVAMVREQHPD